MNVRSLGLGLSGRMGLYRSADGYIVERDEAFPELQAWLVSGPGIDEAETVIGLTGIRRRVLQARQDVRNTSNVASPPGGGS